jgi:hypothetical protein
VNHDIDRKRTTLLSLAAFGVACLLFAACDSDSEGSKPILRPGDASAGDLSDKDAAAGNDAAKPRDPLYALAILVFGPDTTTTYVSVLDSLDVSSIDLDKAREFPGDADIATYDGKLFVSDAEAPTVHRFGVSDDGELTDEGTISFASLGLESVTLRDNAFISPTKAYLGDGGGYAIWNPRSMEITGEIEVPALEAERDGMILDGSPGVVRGDRLYKTFYWEDWMTYTFSTEQYIATYDTENDALIDMVAEERCPNLGAIAQKDEDDNLYFSNWFYNVPGTLMKDAPHSCALRIPKGSDTVDPDWTLRFDEVTGGHEGAQLSYISKGQAVFAAFHEEDFTITEETEPYDIPASVNWETWAVDLKDPSSAKPIDGMDRMVADQTVFTLDGRSFVLAPGADWETTQIYELLANASSRLAFTIEGWSRGFLKIK